MPRPAELRDAAERIGVAAGILLGEDSRILLAERRDDVKFPGFWEFPGGKIAAGESPEAALHRELREELGIEIGAYQYFSTIDHDYDDRRVRLHFYTVTAWNGKVRGTTGQRLRWVALSELDAGDLLPADRPVIAALRKLSPG